MSESLVQKLSSLDSKIKELEAELIAVKNKRLEPLGPIDLETEITKVVDIHFVNNLYRNNK